ncbi:PspC domain-containing protein [Thermomonospora amylolytica]|uniref:PspC domain-containing protein n=1 Tax=Thermomonospora amylolytica TaxID=1411117 RepID=UPI000E6C7978|nr:PspC domain-containing protein [Thermomonospora amylolytica]
MTQERYVRLARPGEGRIVAGVCAGLGAHVGVDPVVLRVAFAVLTLAGGQGIVLYVVAALLMPSDQRRTAPIEQMLRRRYDAGGALVILGGLLALLTLVTAIGHGFSGNALAEVTVFALVVLVAHARKVDFAEIARTLPERLQGHPLEPEPPAVDLAKPAPAPGRQEPLPEGMVDLALLGERRRGAPPPEPAPAGKPRKPHGCGPKSRLTTVTLLGATAAAAAMIPVVNAQDPGGAYGANMMLAAALAVVGLGLLVGGWAGRPRGLAATGTLLTLSLLTSTAVAEAPGGTRYGDVQWRPVDATGAGQTYRLAVGSGRLDLTSLPLAPGRRIPVEAVVLAGSLKVIVPDGARVEVNGETLFGDLTVDGRISGGPGAKAVTVLEPVRAVADPPVIELRIRARVADVEVRRG